MNEYMDNDDMNSNKNPGNIVAVYNNAEGLDDFPVLKAFQQYVDAEQAKAHRRLMSVCAFFTVFIILLVGAFIAILLTWRHDPSYQLTLNALTQNNNNLQKQLLDQAVLMNEKLLSNIANNPAQANTSTKDELQKFKDELKAEMDAKIKSAVDTSSTQRPVAQQQNLQRPTSPSSADAALNAREQELARREAALAQEAERIKKNEEKLRQEEERAKRIAEHRRKLYPEFFDADGVERSKPVTPQKDPEIEKLKAEIESLKKLERAGKKQNKAKPKTNNEDLEELDAILEDAGISGNPPSQNKVEEKKAEIKNQPKNIDVNIGNGDAGDWTIPLE